MADPTPAAPSIILPASERPTASPEQPYEPENRICGMPMGWVKGGTTSYSWDMQVKAMEADAEKRRAELDRDRANAAAGVVATGTKLHSHNFTDPRTSPKVLLTLVNDRKETQALILADIVISDNIDGEMSIIWPCPDCVERGVPQGQAQNRASNKSRHWALDPKGEGLPIRWEDATTGRVEWFISAGTVMDTEIFKCPGVGCSMWVKIHKNMMYRVRG